MGQDLKEKALPTKFCFIFCIRKNISEILLNIFLRRLFLQDRMISVSLL